jgi:hypothetical protein
MTPSVSSKPGISTSVSFSCAECGVSFVFYGADGGPYLQGVIDALLEEHAGHAFDMIEQNDGGGERVKKYKSTKVPRLFYSCTLILLHFCL